MTKNQIDALADALLCATKAFAYLVLVVVLSVTFPIWIVPWKFYMKRWGSK